MSEVIYAREERLSVGEYLDVVGHSTLGATRPLADGERIGAMIAHSDLIVSARIEGRCVGLARCLTDFAWVAYCCDLAVHADFQGRGIGTELLRTCRQLLGAGIGIALLSIPEAVGYYDRLERIGLRRYPHAYWMSRGPDA
ncbi:MAG TPA: GNAT family N-acetyltransferase [Alphaproteobacteria bacterium]|nr:GNAT family N-acetyltransferase [Alphaproteobacteria bacterium]